MTNPHEETGYNHKPLTKRERDIKRNSERVKKILESLDTPKDDGNIREEVNKDGVDR